MWVVVLLFSSIFNRKLIVILSFPTSFYNFTMAKRAIIVRHRENSSKESKTFPAVLVPTWACRHAALIFIHFTMEGQTADEYQVWSLTLWIMQQNRKINWLCFPVRKCLIGLTRRRMGRCTSERSWTSSPSWITTLSSLIRCDRKSKNVDSEVCMIHIGDGQLMIKSSFPCCQSVLLYNWKS